MAGKLKDTPLVNAKKNTHSCLTLIDFGFDLTGWTVKGDVTDMKAKGVWKAKRSKTPTDQKSEFRLILKCDTEPRMGGGRPDAGELTITITKGPEEVTVDPPPKVDYADDDAP
jgi:hypothetical protein